MKVNELKDKIRVDKITLKIISKEEPKEVRGGSLRVCNLTGEDDTDKVTIALWNDDIDKVKEGDTIKITNGWSQIFQDSLQVSPGKFGTLEIIDEK